MVETQKAIDKRNAKFANATPAEKRVMMAKHALLWLGEGALIAKTGVYVGPVNIQWSYLKRDRPEILQEQARDVVLGPCLVCAKGALLVAKAVLFDAVTVEEMSTYAGDDLLENEFDPEQTDLIERAFEDKWPSFSSFEQYIWYDNYKDPRDRMVAILENIIRNKGTFVYDQVRAPT